jgi:hypothetical protein
MTVNELKTEHNQWRKWLARSTRTRDKLLDKLSYTDSQIVHTLIDRMRDDKSSIGWRLREQCYRHGVAVPEELLKLTLPTNVTHRGIAEAWHAITGYLAAAESIAEALEIRIDELEKKAGKQTP